MKTDRFKLMFIQLNDLGSKGYILPILSRPNRQKRSNRGFSLVEILIVIALLGVVSIPLGAAMTMGLKTFQTESKAVQVEQDHRSALSWITELCRTYPDEVTITESPDIITVHGHQFKLSSEDLIEESSAANRTLCSYVNTFDVTSIERNSSGVIQSFNLNIKTHYNNSELNLTTTIQLNRY